MRPSDHGHAWLILLHLAPCKRCYHAVISPSECCACLCASCRHCTSAPHARHLHVSVSRPEIGVWWAAYQNAVRDQRLAHEISAAKRERDFYMSRVDKAKGIAAQQERKRKVNHCKA